MNLFKTKDLMAMETGDFAENTYYRFLRVPGGWVVTDIKSNAIVFVKIPGIDNSLNVRIDK